jgi:hypothetical protein
LHLRVEELIATWASVQTGNSITVETYYLGQTDSPLAERHDGELKRGMDCQ